MKWELFGPEGDKMGETEDPEKAKAWLDKRATSVNAPVIYPNEEPDSHEERHECPCCGTDNTYVYDAGAGIRECRECRTRWDYAYAE